MLCMHSSLLPIASSPALAYAARKEMPFCWLYSIMLAATQLALTPVGVAFLLITAPHADIAIAAVAVYIPFTLVKLVQSSLAFGMSRTSTVGGLEAPLLNGTINEGDVSSMKVKPLSWASCRRTPRAHAVCSNTTASPPSSKPPFP
jgi:hypothetical protein